MNNSSLRIFAKGIVGASLLALAIPAQAADNQPEMTKVAGTTEGGKDAGKDEKLICKRIDDTTSRMKSVRACHTKAEWRKIEDARS